MIEAVADLTATCESLLENIGHHGSQNDHVHDLDSDDHGLCWRTENHVVQHWPEVCAHY